MNTLLITPGRAGSTHLTRVFEQHQSVVSTQEIFHPGWLEKMLGSDILARPEVDSMHEDPGPFLDMVFNNVHEKLASANVGHIVTHVCAKVVGVSAETIKRIDTDTDYKAIVLVRKNITEAVVSGIIASETGKWSWDARPEDPGFRMKPMFIDMDWIERNLMAQSASITALSTATLADPGRYLWLYYEDVFTQSAANACFNFQGLVPIRDFEISTIKMNPPKNYDLIFNRKEIDQKFGSYFGKLGSKKSPEFWSGLFSDSKPIHWAGGI